MRILILNQILYSGNGEKLPIVKSIKDTMIYSMALGFKQLGHDVTLLAMEEYRPTDEDRWDFNILFFKNILKDKFTSALPLSLKMHKYIKHHAGEYDMILSSEVFGFHTLSAALLEPKKTLIWQELNVHQKKMHHIPSKLWHNIIVSVFFRKIRVVVARSESARDFISHYSLNVATEVVDHGIDINKFKFSVDKDCQFISVAQLIDRKGVDGIIKKFSNLLKIKRYDHYKLLIAGRGPLEESLRMLVEELGIKDNVEFLGFLDQATLNHYISHSIASLINTKQDLNMVSITEAIVSGTPIITNMIPALAPYINRENLGIAKNDWDEKDMVEIIDNEKLYSERCISHRDKLSSLNAAKKLILNFYEYEGVANK